MLSLSEYGPNTGAQGQKAARSGAWGRVPPPPCTAAAMYIAAAIAMNIAIAIDIAPCLLPLNSTTLQALSIILGKTMENRTVHLDKPPAIMQIDTDSAYIHAYISQIEDTGSTTVYKYVYT